MGGRKGTRPVKNRVVGCWCGYLSGARCGLAYGPADATATHCLSKIQIGFTFLVPAHLGSPGQRAVKRVCCRFFCSTSFTVTEFHVQFSNKRDMFNVVHVQVASHLLHFPNIKPCQLLCSVTLRVLQLLVFLNMHLKLLLPTALTVLRQSSAKSAPNITLWGLTALPQTPSLAGLRGAYF